jgi:hypothetical protein
MAVNWLRDKESTSGLKSASQAKCALTGRCEFEQRNEGHDNVTRSKVTTGGMYN